MSESEGDKKRNKLGYQRISVACAHCRRRKIRCVMADGDPQGRCQNCIRLQKSCIFHPVEQTGDSSTQQGSPDTDTNHSRLAPLPSNVPRGFPVYDTSSQGTPHSFEPQWPVQAQTDDVYWGEDRAVSPDNRSLSFSSAIPDPRQWQMLQQQGRSMSYGAFPTQPFPQDMSGLQHHPTFPLDTQSASSMRMPGPHSAPAFPQQFYQQQHQQQRHQQQPQQQQQQQQQQFPEQQGMPQNWYEQQNYQFAPGDSRGPPNG